MEFNGNASHNYCPTAFRMAMKKSFVAVGFCFLMFTFSLSGCLSGEDGSQGEQGPQGVAGIDGEDGSSLHVVSSSRRII